MWAVLDYKIYGHLNTKESFDFIFNLLTYASIFSKKDLWSFYKYVDTSLL